MKVIEVGCVIKSILLSKKEVTDKIGKKIDPVVSLSELAGPFVTYCRTGVAPTYTKDKMSLEDTATVDVTIHAATYEQSIDLLRVVFHALQGYRGICEGIKIGEIRMIDASEDFQVDSFLQNLTFEIDVIND